MAWIISFASSIVINLEISMIFDIFLILHSFLTPLCSASPDEHFDQIALYLSASKTALTRSSSGVKGTPVKMNMGIEKKLMDICSRNTCVAGVDV